MIIGITKLMVSENNINDGHVDKSNEMPSIIVSIGKIIKCISFVLTLIEL